VPARNADGNDRDGTGVAHLVGFNLNTWPEFTATGVLGAESSVPLPSWPWSMPRRWSRIPYPTERPPVAVTHDKIERHRADRNKQREPTVYYLSRLRQIPSSTGVKYCYRQRILLPLSLRPATSETQSPTFGRYDTSDGIAPQLPDRELLFGPRQSWSPSMDATRPV